MSITSDRSYGSETLSSLGGPWYGLGLNGAEVLLLVEAFRRKYGYCEQTRNDIIPQFIRAGLLEVIEGNERAGVVRTTPYADSLRQGPRAPRTKEQIDMLRTRLTHARRTWSRAIYSGEVKIEDSR